MREISLDRLRTLIAITERGSFADAARALNLAPPTVSLHIAELEDRIGAALLSRKRGQVRPSAIGEVLVERARRLLADAEQALDDIQRQVQGLHGRDCIPVAASARHIASGSSRHRYSARRADVAGDAVSLGGRNAGCRAC